MSHRLSGHFTSKNTISELLTAPKAQGPKALAGRRKALPAVLASQDAKLRSEMSLDEPSAIRSLHSLANRDIYIYRLQLQLEKARQGKLKVETNSQKEPTGVQEPNSIYIMYRTCLRAARHVLYIYTL